MKEENKPKIIVSEENETNLPNVKKYSIEDFKAFSYFFNGKRDTVIKLFHDNKRVTFNDIKELFKKIDDKLQTHVLVTNQLGITVSLSDGNIRDYSNFQVFVDDDWRITEKSESLLFEWEFTLNHPNFTFPQKHTVKLRIGSSLRPDEMFKLMMTGSEDHELEEATSQIVLRIDFINPSISNDIKNCINDWYDALTQNSPQRGLIKFLRKQKNFIGSVISFLFILIGFILIGYFALSYLNRTNSNIESNKILFISIGSLLIGLSFFSAIGKYYANWIIRKTINKFKNRPYLTLTKGDENQIIESKQENNQLLKQLLLKMTVTFIFIIITWLLGSFSDIIIDLIQKQ